MKRNTWLLPKAKQTLQFAVSEPHKTRSSRETSRNNSPPPARLSRLTQGRDHEEESHLFLSLLITYNMDGDDDQGTWN